MFSVLLADAHSIWSTRPGRRAISLACTSGSIWLTRDGEDVIMSAGDRIVATGTDRVVLEALEPSQVEVEETDTVRETPKALGPKTSVVVLALFALYVIWGSTYLAMRIALETMPPFLMAGPRFLLAGLGMYGFLRWRGAPAPTREQWIASAKIGLLLLTLGNGAVAIAEQSVSSSVAAIVVASMPIWAAVFGRVAGLRAKGGEWLGLLLGFSGVVLLNLSGGLHLDGRGLVLVVAPLAWAAGSVWSKKLPLPEGPMSTATQMISGGVSMLILAVVTGERMPHPSLRSLSAMLYLAIFGSIVAFTAYNWLLRNVRATLATSYAYVNPIVAVFLGWALGGESITRMTLAAAGVSIAGVALIARPAK
ncbi:MAG: drug/metabolite exporter YedA [Polyangiales bacterium]